MARRQAPSQMYFDESVLGGPMSRKTPVDDMSMGSSPGAPMAASTVMKTNNKFQEYLDDDHRGSIYGQQHFVITPKSRTAQEPQSSHLNRPRPDSPEQSKKKLKTKGLLDSLDSDSSTDIDNFLKTHNLSDMLEKMPSNLSLSIQTDLGRDSLSRESIGLNNTGSSLGILSIDSMHDLSGSLLQIGSPVKEHHGSLSGIPDLDTTLTPDSPLSAPINNEPSEQANKFFATPTKNDVNDNANTCKDHHSLENISESCVDCMIKSNTHQQFGSRNYEIKEYDLETESLRDFDCNQTKQKQRSNVSGAVMYKKSDIQNSEAKDIQANAMQPRYSGNIQRFPPEKLDSMFFEHSPMANMPRPGSGDGEEIFPPRLPSQGQEQSFDSLPSQIFKVASDGANATSLQNTGSELSFAGSSLPFKPSQQSPPLGARRPSDGSEGSWQDAAVTRQKKFTKSTHSLRKSVGIQERLSQGVRGRAIGSESMDSSDIDTEDELDAVRKELEERNNYIEPTERECVGESEESSNDGRPGLEGGSSDDNDVPHTFSAIPGARESAEGEVIAPVHGDGGGGGDGMSDGEDVSSRINQPSLMARDFFHGINSDYHGTVTSNQHIRNIEGQSQGPSRGQPVGNGMITPFRQVRFASKDEVNTLSMIASDSDYSMERPSIASVTSDTSRGNYDTEMPSMFLNPNTNQQDSTSASANPLQASSIHFEEGESMFDVNGKDSSGVFQSPQGHNPFDHETASPGKEFIGRSSLGDLGDITFSQKFSFGDDEFSHMEISARSSGSDHSSTRSSTASRRLTGNSCNSSQNGSHLDDQYRSVYLDDDGKVVNDLAFRNSLPIMQQKDGLAPSTSFEDFISSEDAGFGEEEFIGGDDALDMIDKAEQSFQQENIFRQDEHIDTTSPPSSHLDWSTSNSNPADVEKIFDRYNDITGTEDFCRISIGTFMGGRTEALGSLSGNANTARPEFGGGKVVSPSSGLPHALYDNVDMLDDTSLHEASTVDDSTWVDDPNYTMSGFIGANKQRNSKSESGKLDDNTFNVTSGVSRTLNDNTSQMANMDSGLDITANPATPISETTRTLDITHTPAINMSAITSAIVNASSSTKPQELAAMILALSNKPKLETVHQKTSVKSDLKSNDRHKEEEKKSKDRTQQNVFEGDKVNSRSCQIDNTKQTEKCNQNISKPSLPNLTNYQTVEKVKSSHFENSNQVFNKKPVDNSFKVEPNIMSKGDISKNEKSSIQKSGPRRTSKENCQIPFLKDSKRTSGSSSSSSQKEKQYNLTRPQRVGDGVEDTTSKVRLSSKRNSSENVRTSQVHAMQCVAPYRVKMNVGNQTSKKLSSSNTSNDSHREQKRLSAENSEMSLRNSDIGPTNFNKVFQLHDTHSEAPSNDYNTRNPTQVSVGKTKSGSCDSRPMVGHVEPIQSTGQTSESVEDIEKSDAMIVEMLRQARRKKASQVVSNSQRQDKERPHKELDATRAVESSIRPHANYITSSHGNNGEGKDHPSIIGEPVPLGMCDPFTSGDTNKDVGRNSNIQQSNQARTESKNLHTKDFQHSNQNSWHKSKNNVEKSHEISSSHTNRILPRTGNREQLQSIENRHHQINLENEQHNRATNYKDRVQDGTLHGNCTDQSRKPLADKKEKRSSPRKGQNLRKHRDSDILVIGQHRIPQSKFMSDIMNETEDSFFNITQSQPNGVDGSPEHVTEEPDINKLLADIERDEQLRQKVHVSPTQETNSPRKHERLSQKLKSPSSYGRKDTSMSPRSHDRPSSSMSPKSYQRPMESNTTVSPRTHERSLDSVRLKHNSLVPQTPHARHATEEYPHLGASSISGDHRYFGPQVSNSSNHEVTDKLSSLNNLHSIPISSFQPISDSQCLSVPSQSSKPTLLTSQSLLTNVVASQYLNDRPIMTSNVSGPSASTNSQFYGHTGIPPRGLHSTYAYGTMPTVSSDTQFLPVSSSHGHTITGRMPFISTLPGSTALSHFHGQAALPRPSIVANLVVPRQLRFQGVCCVGIAAQATLPLHNPSSRWLQCSLELISVNINGEEVNSITKPAFLIHPKTIISPRNTEEVKVIFMPKYPGIYIAEVQVASSPVVADSEATMVQMSPPQTVTIQGLAEKPNIQIRESSDGCIHFGNVNQNTSLSKRILMVNCGRATVPVRIALISGSLMHHLSFSVGDKSNTGISTKPVHTTLAGHENQAEEPPSIAVWVHIKTSSKLSNTSSSKLGPPDIISGQLQVEFDTPEQHEYLAVLPIKGLVGLARLHAPKSLQVMNFTSSVGQSCSRNFPLKNAGNLSLDVQLLVTRAKDLFSMVPERITIEPGEEREIMVKYRPKEAPSEVESTLIVEVLPDGPQYEVVLSGKAITATAPKHQESSVLPILCTKQFVVWGGVPVGRALQQKLTLKNASETQLIKLKLSIRGNTEDFQLQSFFGQQEKLTDNRQVVLKPFEELPVHILFAPTAESTMKATLHIKPISSQTKFTVPLSGYGGVSNIILNGLTHVGDTYLSNIMNVVAGQTRTLSFEALNTGSRTAFVKIIAFADLKGSEKLEPKRIKIKPDEFILKKEKLQKVTLTLHLTKTDSVLCSEQSHLLCAIGIFYGDEITRHQYRRAQKIGNAKEVTLSSSNPLKDVEFDKSFLNEEKVDEKFNLPPTPNDKQLFYSCMSRLMVSLIGASKDSDSSTPFEDNWTPKKMNDEIMKLPKEIKNERWSDLMSSSMPIKDIPTAPSTHNAMHSTLIVPSSDSTPWSIRPDHLVLHVQSQAVSKGRVQVINSTDRSLSFELTWPGHCLSVTPQTGVVESRNQILVLISPSPSLVSRGVQLPWGGSVYIKCDGDLKEIKVQIREDMALDTSIYPSRGHLTSLDNQPSTPAEVIGVPRNAVSELIKVKSRTVSFAETKVGSISEAIVEFKSMTNEVLRWCLSSFAPAYVKQDSGEIFRATYSAFRFAKQSGSILSGQEFKVLVTFIPREIGKYSQYWNLEYEPRERMAETQSVRIEMTAVATKDGSEKSNEGDNVGQDKRISVTKKDPEYPTKGKSNVDVRSLDQIEVAASELVFPATELNKTSMLKVNISNCSDHDQEVKFISPKSPFSLKHKQHVLKSKAYARLPIFFKPTLTGKYSGLLVIKTVSNDNLMVKLEGQAI